MSEEAKKPQPASTVILIRQQGAELQVYLLKRSQESSFFPATYVFPGGGVEPEDRGMSRWIPHVDMDKEEIFKRLGGGMSIEDTVAFGVSAVRETFEEAGVLLWRPSDHGAEMFEEIRTRRMEHGLPEGWLKDFLVSGGCQLEFSRLGRWAHWITPEAMPRRYEARFFVAFMPQGQECMPDLIETTDGIWIRPEKALSENLKGEIPLGPPTLITLHQLMDYEDLDALRREVEARSWGDALLPRMIKLSRGAIILEPWDPLYTEHGEVNDGILEEAVLPPGEPFSRIWYYEGIWRPVRS
jgi:8-oxo-dGTP pyrophosphatase MutT (NUDIX family)